MKKMSMATLPALVFILVVITTANAQPSLEDPQAQISGQQKLPDDKTQPVKPPPEIGRPKQSRKICPQTRYIDCMPPEKAENRQMCSKEYLEWIKEQCPNVEVVY